MAALLGLALLFSVCALGQTNECYYCTTTSCNPSITDVSSPEFNPTGDAEVLRGAMAGFGTDEPTLIRILTSRTELQREAISDEYVKYGGSLASDIDGDTSRSFRKMLVALVTPLLDFYTMEIQKAIENDDRPVVIEILSILTPCVIRRMANKYSDLNKKRNLFHDVQGYKLKDLFKFSNSDYNNLIRNLAQGIRDEDLFVDKAIAGKDAKRLKKAGVDRWGTDEATFIDIYSKRSFPQLKETIVQYEELRKGDEEFQSMEKDIESEFSGNIKLALITLTKNARSQPLYFAEELKKILDKWLKWSNDDEKVIRIIRGRCDIDLQDIKTVYKEQFGESLYNVLEGGLKFFKTDYKKTLLAIVKN